MEHCIAWRYPDNMAGSNLMRYTTLMGGMSTKNVQSNACWEIWSCHGGCYYRPKKAYVCYTEVAAYASMLSLLI